MATVLQDDRGVAYPRPPVATLQVTGFDGVEDCGASVAHSCVSVANDLDCDGIDPRVPQEHNHFSRADPGFATKRLSCSCALRVKAGLPRSCNGCLYGRRRAAYPKVATANENAQILVAASPIRLLLGKRNRASA
jgi:hypothetical protein